MQAKKFNRGKIVIKQGDTEENFYILRAGYIQVHVEILIYDFSIVALGPSQWNVTRKKRTIQVADNV